MSEDSEAVQPAGRALASRSAYFHRLMWALLPIQAAFLAAGLFSVSVLFRDQTDTTLESGFAAAGIAGALGGLVLTGLFLLRYLRQSAEAVVLLSDLEHATVRREAMAARAAEREPTASIEHLEELENEARERLHATESADDESAYREIRHYLLNIRLARMKAELAHEESESLSRASGAELQMLAEADERTRTIAGVGDAQLASVLRSARLRLSDAVEAGKTQE